MKPNLSDHLSHLQPLRRPLILFLVVIVALAGLGLAPAGVSQAAAGDARPPANGTPSPRAAVTATPTPAQTGAPAAAPNTTVQVTGYYVNLRAGPGFNYPSVHKVRHEDALHLLGRLNDSSWLWVKTDQGQEGWIGASWVDLGDVDISLQPVQTPTPVEYPVSVLGGKVNLRTGPGLVYPTLRKLTYGDPLTLVGRSEDSRWLFLRTPDGETGWTETDWINLGNVDLRYHSQPVVTAPPTPTATLVVLPDVEGHWIDIDLSEQTLRAYDGTTLVKTFLVSTGVDNYWTEAGQYHVQVKMRYSDMRGNDYFLPDVPYTMYYSGDFSIHGTYWHRSFGTRMSRGCVNMDTNDAEWLYNWSDVGTLVNIHR